MNFVTGGTGLVGSHLLVELVRQGMDVTATYRSKSRIQQVRDIFNYYFNTEGEKQFMRINWVQADILDIPSLNDAIPENSDVYHCAALVSFHRKDYHRLMKINREGTANVVNVCLEKKVRKLCYVSSTAAIGGGSVNVITEKTKWKKGPETSGYSVSKYSAEKEVWRGIEEGLDAVMVNPCVILGAGNWSESSLTIFKAVSRGSKFYPPGSNATVDARDVAEIMVKLMKSDIISERYLCIGSNQSIQELMTEIAKQLQIKGPTKRSPRWLVNLVRRILGFISIFSSKKPAITKENVDSVFGHKKYSSLKIQNELNFKFKTLEESVKNGIEGRLKY